MKREKSILFFFVIVMFCSHIPFDASGIRVKFPFYDYSSINPEGRLLANYLWDLSMFFIAWVFLFFSWLKDNDRIDFYFLIWMSYNIITYILFFQQGANLIGIPLILILLLYENRTSIKNIRGLNNIRSYLNDLFKL